MALSDRFEWIALGRVIGTVTGWDLSDTITIQLYDFEPVGGCKIPAGGPSINFATGTAQTYDENGDIVSSIDLVEAIGHLPISPISPEI